MRSAAPDPILAPVRRSRRAATEVIDAHAHFFNASDVPVKGFIAESIGHNAPGWLQPLIAEMAALAESLANRAPTAFDELNSLNQLSTTVRGRSTNELRAQVDLWFNQERQAAAERVADVVGGTGFERRYRALVPQSQRSGPRISPDEVLEVVTEARQPAARSRRGAEDLRSGAAKAKLEFLFYMLSKRASNIRTYKEAFTPDDSAFGVDRVLGALVDFDYWLDCPPMSAHEDQIALHQHLAAMHDGYLQPVVGYNPWTDIAQGGAGLKRVRDAWATGVFVAAKIYPPTGFMPSGNADHTADTKKRRPNLKDLDASLSEFFALCAQEAIPVLAHAARSNGRDSAHDDFSNPRHWGRLLSDLANKAGTPIISFGHIGGDDPGTDWTAQFTQLIKTYPKLHLFGDLGYWDHLMCQDAADCAHARARLKAAIGTPVVDGETVGDRVMFATDWLMMSQVPDWQAYPLRVREGLEEITDADGVVKIFGANARKCFARLAANPVASV